MPRFFFYLRSDNESSEHATCLDLADLDAARREALAAAKDLIVDKLNGGEALDGQVYEIRGEDGRLLDVVPVEQPLRGKVEIPKDEQY
jgi:hypothetical protein